MNPREMLEDILENIEEFESPSDSTPTHRVTYRGRDMPCSVSSERIGEILVVGGVERQVVLTLKIRKSLLQPLRSSDMSTVTADSGLTVDLDQITPRPNKEIEITTRNRTYRIGNVSWDALGAYCSMDLVDAYIP